MTVVLAWLRLDLPRRWRSLAVLALLVAVAGGTVLASVTGARRAETAAARLWARTLPASAAVLPNDPGFDWEVVRRLPGVAAVAGFAVAPFFVDELPDYQGYLPPADDVMLRDVERPVVLQGRLADPARADEVVVTSQVPDSYGLDVGDSLTLHLMTPQQADDPDFFFSGAAAPGGPQARARIVGVVRSPWFHDDLDSKGSIIPSAALVTHHRANFLGARESFAFVNALVRLDGGEAALPAFRRNLTEATGRSDIDVWNNADLLRHQQKVDSFEATCLLAFGLAALAAAIVLVGQALARHAEAVVADLRVLQALGMGRGQSAAAAAAGPALAGLIGATLAVAGALAASGWMPIGSASAVEPAPGVDADRVVLGGGWLVVVVLVTTAAVVAARLALAGLGSGPVRRSTAALAAARVGLPLPVTVGTRFALEPGRRRTAVPVRPALTGAIVGVLGVVAALTFSAGVADAASNPRRFGQTYQLVVVFGEGGRAYAPTGPALTRIAADADVLSVNDARVAVAESGTASVTLYTHEVTGQGFPVVLHSGRMPEGADEVVLAPTTAARLGAAQGEQVSLVGNRPGARTLTVTGVGFVPETSHNTYDSGGWVTAEGYDRLFDGFKNHVGLVALRHGADPPTVQSRLAGVVSAPGGKPIVLVPPVPSRLREIRQVQGLPVALAAFLALLAAGAVGHALATAVRRRRHDVAVLRALGMTRGQSIGVVVTQASVLAGVGVLFGVPLGLALGRAVWRVVADYTPVEYAPPAAVLALLLVVPGALLVANLLAAEPGRQAARLRVAHVLRVE